MASGEKSGERTSGVKYTAKYDVTYNINKNAYVIRLSGIVTPIVANYAGNTYHTEVKLYDSNGKHYNTIMKYDKSFEFGEKPNSPGTVLPPLTANTVVFDYMQEVTAVSGYSIQIFIALPDFEFYSGLVTIWPDNSSLTLNTSSTVTPNSCNLSWSSNINLQSLIIKNGNDTLYNNISLNTKSGTANFTGLMPNTTYTLSITGKRYNSSSTTTKNISVTTTAFPVITSPLNFTIGNNLTVNLSSGFALAYKIQVKISNTAKDYLEYLLDVPASAKSVILNSGDSTVIDSLYQLSSTDKTLTITMHPYYTGTNYKGEAQTSAGSISTGTVTIPNSPPHFLNFTYGNSDELTLNLLGDSKYFVQGHGNLKVVISVDDRALPANYATVKKYVCELRRSQINGTTILNKEFAYYDDLDIILNFGALNTSSDVIDPIYIKIYAIDSRGFVSETITKVVYILPYQIPSINFSTLSRFNEFEQEIIWEFDSYYSSLPINGINKNIPYEIKVRTYEIGTAPSGSYITLSLPNNNITAFSEYTTKVIDVKTNTDSIINLNRERSYYIEFMLTDSLTTYTYIGEIHAGISILGILDDGHVTVGRLPDLNNECLLQVGSDILLTDEEGNDRKLIELVKDLILESDKRKYPIGKIILSTETVNPVDYLGFGTWVAWGSGRVPVGVNTGDGNFNIVEKIGGASTINLNHSHTVNNHIHDMSHSHAVNSHTHSTQDHILTIDEMPGHRHYQTEYWNRGGNGTAYTQGSEMAQPVAYGTMTSPTRYTGGGQAHNHGNTGTSAPGTNAGTRTTTDGSAPETTSTLLTEQSILQPYITCYMWKRTA